MKYVKLVFRTAIGAILGIVSGIALIPAFAAFGDGNGNTSWVFFVVVGIGALLGFFAPTIRRAFGRGFLLAGVSVLALPLSMMMLSGRVASDLMQESGNQVGTAIGAGIAATTMTGISAFIGIIGGAILLIVGLVLSLGGRREVIVVQHPVEPNRTRHEPSL